MKIALKRFLQTIAFLCAALILWLFFFVILILIHAFLPSSSYIAADGAKTLKDGAVLQIVFLPIILTTLITFIFLRVRKNRGLAPFLFERLSRKETSNLYFSAHSAVNTANKTRDLDTFFQAYKTVLFTFKRLSEYRTTGLKGDAKADYTRLLLDQQKHIRDAIERCGKAIVDDYNGLYRYEEDYIKDKISKYAQAIETHAPIMNKSNLEYANTHLRYVQKHCGYLTEEKASQHTSEETEDRNLVFSAAASIYDSGQPSVSMIQRKLHLEYSQAAKILEYLELIGIVSPFDGSNPRYTLKSKSDCMRTIANCKKSGLEYNYFHHKTESTQSKSTETDIDNMEGHIFEHYCASLLMKNGFSEATVTQGSGDHGVDIVAVKDEVRYAIQCKRYNSDIGNTPVQEVYAGKEMYGCQVGVVMTNRYFTAGAKVLAEKTKVLLWDRDKLFDMVNKSE